MKKIIVLILALLLVMTAVACGQGSTGNSDETTGGGNGPESGSAETTGGSTDPDDVTTSNDGEGSGESDVTDETTGGDAETTGGSAAPGLQDATEVDETVYLTVAGAYYRSAPDIYENNIIGRVAWGDELNRVAYNTEWSVILVEGVKYYISTECVSKTAPTEEPTFTETNDTVTVVGSDVALYTAPLATDATLFDYLEEGVKLTRVKYNEKWSVVSHGGYELYLEVDGHTDAEDSEEIEFTEYEATLEVKADGTILYSIASTDTSISETVATLTKGTQIEAVSVSEDGLWYSVYYFHTDLGVEQRVYIQASAVTVMGEDGESSEEELPEDGEDIPEDGEEEE